MDDPIFDPTGLLCHYTTADTAFSHILPTGKLRMNPYSKMRDPFENKNPHFRQASYPADADVREMNALVLDLADQFVRSRDGMRLLSFTRGDEQPNEDPSFLCAWSRPRMWEQYAEKHHGVCLAFDRPSLLQTLHRQLTELGKCWDGQVKYTLTGFYDSEGADVLLPMFRADQIEQDFERHIEKHFDDFFFLKTLDWASEFEYRVIFREEPGSSGGVEPPPYDVKYEESLRYVILGENFPDWQRAGAQAVAEKAGAQTCVMTWGAPVPFPNPL